MLTVDRLLSKYELIELRIIEQDERFRYVHIYADKKLKLIAFSSFVNSPAKGYNTAKALINSGEPIGLAIKSVFKNFKKTQIDRGFIKANFEVIENFQQLSNNCHYKLFKIEVYDDDNDFIFCNVFEVYSNDFVEEFFQNSINEETFAREEIDIALVRYFEKFGFELETENK